MTRKKTPPEHASVRVLRSFNGMRKGDEALVPLTKQVLSWIDAGFMELMNDGKDQTGPGGAEPDHQGGVAFGAGDSGPSGDEQGQGFGAGGYGASEG